MAPSASPKPVTIPFPGGPAEVIPVDAPGAGEPDMAQIASLLSGKRVIGLGEATHGTHEFATLRTALLRQLIQDGHVGAVALEASFGDCIDANRYVLGGGGSAAEAVARINNWPWRTEEMAAVVEMIRQENLRSGQGTQKVEFLCFDIQQVRGALTHISATHSGAEGYGAIAPPIERLLAHARSDTYFEKWPDELVRDATQVASFVAALPAASGSFVDHDLLAESIRGAGAVWGKPEMLQQVLERDDLMARQLLRISQKFPKHAVGAWAHNGHVMRYTQEIQPGLIYHTLGSRMTDLIGADYAAIGLVFDRGDFRAIDSDAGGAPRPWTVGPSREGSVSRLLADAGLSSAYIDLTHPANAAALGAGPLAYRQIEAVFSSTGENDAYADENLPKLFDGLLFVAETGPTKPLPSPPE
jgi:erythromycin esterase